MVASLQARILTTSTKPPKRTAAQQGRPRKPPGERQSKLAKEHNITAREEAEIREAFSLFAEPMDGEKEGVIPIGDLRSALMLASSSRAPTALLAGP